MCHCGNFSTKAIIMYVIFTYIVCKIGYITRSPLKKSFKQKLRNGRIINDIKTRIFKKKHKVRIFPLFIV